MTSCARGDPMRLELKFSLSPMPLRLISIDLSIIYLRCKNDYSIYTILFLSTQSEHYLTILKWSILHNIQNVSPKEIKFIHGHTYISKFLTSYSLLWASLKQWLITYKFHDDFSNDYQNDNMVLVYFTQTISE